MQFQTSLLIILLITCVDDSIIYPNKGVHNTSDIEIVETYPVVIMDETFNKLKLASITKEYFKKLVQRAKYSLKQKSNLAKLLVDFFGDNLKCDFYAEWLAQEIGICSLQELHNILRHKDTKSILGRPCNITVETKLKVQDYWKANSVISVDRRNQRNNI